MGGAGAMPVTVLLSRFGGGQCPTNETLGLELGRDASERHDG